MVEQLDARTAACALVPECKQFQPKADRGVPSQGRWAAALKVGPGHCGGAKHWISWGKSAAHEFERVDYHMGAVYIDTNRHEQVPQGLWEEPAFQELAARRSTEAYRYFLRGACRSDPRYMAKVVAWNLYGMEHITPAQKDDAEFFFDVLRGDWRRMMFASRRLRSNGPFVLSAMEINPQVLLYATADLRKLKALRTWAGFGADVSPSLTTRRHF